MEKENKFVRFYAMQSIMLFLATFVLIAVFMVTVILIPLAGLVVIAALIVSVIAIIKALSGEEFKLPVIGKIAAEKA